MTLAKQLLATLEPASLAEYASRGHWVRATHLDVLNRKLLDVAAGTCTRLLVTMPPRHGKFRTDFEVSAGVVARYPSRRPGDSRLLRVGFRGVVGAEGA